MRRRTFLCAFASAWGAGTGLGALAYVRRDGLWVRDLPDGVPRRVAAGSGYGWPRFSPSGKWIACFQKDALDVIAIHDGARTRLGTPPRRSATPGFQWFPSDDRILLATADGVVELTPAGGWRKPARRFPGADLPVALNTAGTAMVYGDAITTRPEPGGEPMRTGRLCRAALDGPSAIEVLHSKWSSARIPYRWIGEHILFWEDLDFSGSLMADGLELFRIPARGGSPESLGVTTLLHEDMLSPEPGGTRIAVCAGVGRNAWEDKRIAVLDTSVARPSYLTPPSVSAVNPAWPPAGDAIAYSAGPSLPGAAGQDARRVLSQRRIRVGTRTLTSDDRYRDEAPMWSAAGDHLLFCRMDHDNRKSLWLIERNGTGAVEVAAPLHNPDTFEDSWFGYYGYLDWGSMFHWRR